MKHKNEWVGHFLVRLLTRVKAFVKKKYFAIFSNFRVEKN